jgi:hypothetical protein
MDVRTRGLPGGHIPAPRNLYWGDLQRSDSLDPALAEGVEKQGSTL